MVVAAIEYGKVAVFAAAFQAHINNFVDDALAFTVFVVAADKAQWVAWAEFAPQGFADEVRVVLDEGVGGFKYAACGTIVLLEFDDV